MTYFKNAFRTIALIGGTLLFLCPCAEAAQTSSAATAPSCQPGSGTFTACIYSGTAFNTFLLQRQDAQINFVWGFGGPYPGGPPVLFSIRWQGNFTFTAGAYRFMLSTDYSGRLYIDGQLVLDHSTRNQSGTVDIVQTLSEGIHLIALEYSDAWDAAYVQLSWQQDAGYRQFYVSPLGNDQNDGRTPATAWQTPTRVDLGTYEQDDHLMFQGGQSFSGVIYFGGNDQGTAAHPVVVTSYGTGRATINPGTMVGLLAYDTAGIEVRNLIFLGTPGNDKDGIEFYQDLPGNVKLSHIVIDNVEVSGFGTAGISIFSWNGTSGYDDIQITNVSTHDNLRAGIWMGSQLSPTQAGYANSNLYIGGCQIYNNIGVTDWLNDTGFGIFLDSTDGAVIEQNVVYNNGQNTLSIAGPMGIMVMESNNIVVQRNEVHHIHTSGSDGGGIDFDGGTTNSVIQYNYTHDNDGSGLTLAQFTPAPATAPNNTIRYNISQNDGRKSISWAGILLAGPVQNSHIYNNTIYGTPNPAQTYTNLMITGQTTGVDIRNNVFFTTGGMQQVAVAGGQTGIALQDNSYWGNGSSLNLSWGSSNSQTLADFRNASGQESINGTPTGLDVDPRLTSPGSGPTFNNVALFSSLTAYTPLSGSPLLDRGITLATFGINPGSRDFIGTSVPQGAGFDIGAVEAISH